MVPYFKKTIILLVVLIVPAYLFSQETSSESFSGTIPQQLIQPSGGEAPRYPRDMVIGTLGQGTAPYAAWRFAEEFVSALIAGQMSSSAFSEVDTVFLENCISALGIIRPLNYHLGGGRREPDGTVSFLVRFLGRERWITGELYLRQQENGWQLDDLLLEDSRSLDEGLNAYSYDFTPYERFF